MTSEAPPPCLSCGTCCFSRLASYVRVDGSDHARLADRADELTVFTGIRCHMKMLEGHCAALMVDELSGRFVCGVYESRPAVCRELERGSPACQGEILSKGTRPTELLLSLTSPRSV